jgi:TPR repeat protein
MTTAQRHMIVDEFDDPKIREALDQIERGGDHATAVTLLVPLAEAGNPKAQCNLAALYQFGLGVEPDGQKCVELYLRVATQNIAEGSLSAVAYNNLATIYTTGLPGIDADHQKAYEYASLARGLGFPI